MMGVFRCLLYADSDWVDDVASKRDPAKSSEGIPIVGPAAVAERATGRMEPGQRKCRTIPPRGRTVLDRGRASRHRRQPFGTISCHGSDMAVRLPAESSETQGQGKLRAKYWDELEGIAQ
jgi:hypothetical protein